MSARVKVISPKEKSRLPAYKVPLFFYENIFSDKSHSKIMESEEIGRASLSGFRQTNTGSSRGMIQASDEDVVSGVLISMSPRLRRMLDNDVSRDFHRRRVALSDGSEAYAYIYEPKKIYLEKYSLSRLESRWSKMRSLEIRRFLKISSQDIRAASIEDIESGESFLAPGDSGSLVRQVQQMLVDSGYILPRYGVDGVIGPETEKAIEVMQKSVSTISSDSYGLVDGDTIFALKGGLTNPSDSDIEELHRFNDAYCSGQQHSDHGGHEGHSDIDKFPEDSLVSIRSFSSNYNLPAESVAHFIVRVSDSEEHDVDLTNDVLQELGVLFQDYGDWSEAMVAYVWGSSTFDDWLDNSNRDIFSVPRSIRRFSSEMSQEFGTGDVFTDRYMDTSGSDLFLTAPMKSMSVTSLFGPRGRIQTSDGGLASSNHRGIDVGASIGTPVYASHSGLVSKTISGSKSAGNYIEITSHNEHFKTLYMHLDKISVSMNQELSSGDQIGESGDTGRVTGPHLHFELKIDGVSVNPMLYIGREVGKRALSSHDIKKKIFKIASEYGPIEEQEATFNEVIETLSDNSNQLIYLDNPKGSAKSFGDKNLKMPFDYGEYPEFINPSDEMGWDIVIVPSASGEFKDIIRGDEHSLEPVGLVPVNPSSEDWSENTRTDENPKGKAPPVGNDKIVLAPKGIYSNEDREVVDNFFDGLWQFEKVVWY